jgi:HlyD family secretion protein
MKQLVWCFAAVLLVTGCNKQDNERSGSGLLEADETIVSSESTGRIVELRIDEGSTVHTSDTFAIIDPSKLTLNLASAQAGRQAADANLGSTRVQVSKTETALKYVQNERNRIAKLASEGTATQKQLDAVEQELSQAKLNLEAAKAAVSTQTAQVEKIDADIAVITRQLADCYPTAPISGTITETFVETGELVTPGKAIAKIAKLDTLWVKLYLPTGSFGQVKLGDKATINTEASGGTYEGTVIWASDEAEFTPKNVQTQKSRANLVYAVKLAIPNNDGKLKIGMPVYITMN